jgi:hypothetical protein
LKIGYREVFAAANFRISGLTGRELAIFRFLGGSFRKYRTKSAVSARGPAFAARLDVAEFSEISNGLRGFSGFGALRPKGRCEVEFWSIDFLGWRGLFRLKAGLRTGPLAPERFGAARGAVE